MGITEERIKRITEQAAAIEDYHDFDVVLEKLADLIDPEGGGDD